ncbi:MAG: hypothetical protein AAGA18_01125 [Verrucomicrobiota bacterium]
MNTETQTEDPILDAFNALETTIDELIGCQKEEQESILSRNPNHLPIITSQIDKHYMRLEQLLRAINQASPATPEAKDDPYLPQRKACRSKMELLQEIALQNHLLLENSLQYLQAIFGEVLGNNDNIVYNQLGISPSGFAPSGSLLNVEI